jgi:membrane-associated phospholipid phosphatase
MGYLGYLLRRGRISDMDVTRREQRARPLIVTLSGLLIAELLFIVGHAPLPFRILAGASLVQAVLVFLITLQWKISMHTSTAAGMTVLILSVAGLAAAPVAISVPLIAWSRVKLRRHTLMQTLAGIGLGIGVFLTAVLLATKG